MTTNDPVRSFARLLPLLIKLRLASTMLAGLAASSSPLPIPAAAFAVTIAGHSVEPVAVKLYDENLHVNATVVIDRDGSTDEATAAEIRHLFRCRMTNREHPIARKSLAMLADIADRYGKTIEFVSVYRLGGGEPAMSPHRDGRAIDFRIRGVQLREIRDYLWRTYTDVGIGWYPSEQFLHMDTRPGLHDTAWTFLGGVNHYHPYWAELARQPAPPVKPDHHRPGA